MVYLLTDSRESRWLPTLICQALNKPCINAALGFNSYVVMRHGARPWATPDGKPPLRIEESSDSVNTLAPEQEEISTIEAELSSAPTPLPSSFPPVDYSSPPHLGCYFCSDVVAPGNSLRDRTLDQQCTVTRPGLSMISSGLAAEMTVAMLHHAKQYAAPASAFNPSGVETDIASTTNIDDNDCAGVGILPHQLRGDMYTMEHHHLTGGAQGVCSACGSTVVEKYKSDPHGFVTRVLNETGYLEEVSGLAQLQRQAEEALLEIEQWDSGLGDGSDCDDF